MANKLVTIRHFSYGSDPASKAELARIKLEVNGIRCFLAGKNFISMYWLLSSADRGIKLQVRESDAEKALDILETDTHIGLNETEDNDMKPEPINRPAQIVAITVSNTKVFPENCSIWVYCSLSFLSHL